MSSKGSSSVRVISGIAFSGNPLSEEVSKPNNSSTESTPQVAPRQRDKEVTRPKHEQEASTSGHENEEEEEEEVEVSCADIISTITGEDAQQIASHYSLEVVPLMRLKGHIALRGPHHCVRGLP